MTRQRQRRALRQRRLYRQIEGVAISALVGATFILFLALWITP